MAKKGTALILDLAGLNLNQIETQVENRLNNGWTFQQIVKDGTKIYTVFIKESAQ